MYQRSWEQGDYCIDSEYSAIEYAIGVKDHDIVKLLLEAGADKDSDGLWDDLSGPDYDGREQIMMTILDHLNKDKWPKFSEEYDETLHHMLRARNNRIPRRIFELHKLYCRHERLPSIDFALWVTVYLSCRRPGDECIFHQKLDQNVFELIVMLLEQGADPDWEYRCEAIIEYDDIDYTARETGYWHRDARVRALLWNPTAKMQLTLPEDALNRCPERRRLMDHSWLGPHCSCLLEDCHCYTDCC